MRDQSSVWEDAYTGARSTSIASSVSPGKASEFRRCPMIGRLLYNAHIVNNIIIHTKILMIDYRVDHRNPDGFYKVTHNFRT